MGRRHLKNTLGLSLILAVAALGLISAIPRVAPVLVLLAAVGLSGPVFDITGRTLLQRSAPSDAIAGLFSILETLMDLGLALGAVLGLVASPLPSAACAPRPGRHRPRPRGGALAAPWQARRGATVTQVEIRLLRSIPIFAALPAPALEGTARELEPVSVATGTTMFHEGDHGDRDYAVAAGSVAISRGAVVVKTVSRGEGFGEIALIHDVPRRATVTAITNASLYSLWKDLFVQAVTGHSAASLAAGRIIAGHLGDQAPKGDDWDTATAQEG